MLLSFPTCRLHKGNTLLACWMVSNRGCSLQGNPKLVWHPACLMKEGAYVNLCLDTMHLKYPLVLFGFEVSALSLPLFLLSPRINMVKKEEPLLVKCYDTMWPLCADMPLSPHSFIHTLTVKLHLIAIPNQHFQLKLFGAIFLQCTAALNLTVR